MVTNLFDWVPMRRGETLPPNAVYAGMTRDDGVVYIGKIDNSPGKVNLKDGKIFNFWSENYSSRSESEVLITNGDKEWVELRHGDNIPEGAICTGRDYNNDKVWVAKDATTDEPGKLTCIDSEADQPKMCKLWCHSYWRFSDMRIAKILVVKPRPHAEPVSLPTIPNLSLEAPNWGEITSLKTISTRFCRCFVHIEVQNLVRSILAGVRLAAGELSSLGDLISSDIHAKIDAQYQYSEETEKSVFNDVEQGVYVMIFYKKKSIDASCSIEDICSCMLTSYSLDITYAIFYPTNQPARDICEEFKRTLVEDSLHRFNSLLAENPSVIEA